MGRKDGNGVQDFHFRNQWTSVRVLFFTFVNKQEKKITVEKQNGKRMISLMLPFRAIMGT